MDKMQSKQHTFREETLTHKALSTLSQKSATAAENGETTATVAEFGDCRTFLGQSLLRRHIVAEIGDLVASVDRL